MISKMTKPQILIGCDPELFVTRDGKPRSAHGLIPGTKSSPYKVPGGAYQVDGMALEFNIDPAKNEEEFVTNIRKVMQRMRQDVPPQYKFHIAPSVKFNGNHLNAQPEEAKELGCEPDFNAYTMEENPRPNSATTLRTASGHIHIGLEKDADPTSEEHRIKYATLAKHLDLFLGIRSLEWDKDQTRRLLYGNPGAVRFKPYGVEYRVLSNMWLEREDLTRFVYQQTIRCINDLMKNGALEPKDYDYIKHDVSRGRAYFTHSLYYMSKKGKAAAVAARELQIGAK
jgi:hypothetical protein